MLTIAYPVPVRLGLILVAVMLCAAPLRAHDSPEHLVEQLTARMKLHGSTPDLLYQRAIEYRVLGKLPAAARDLQSAVKLQPGFATAHAELARICLAQNKTAPALDAIQRALECAAPDADPAALVMIRAAVRSARREHAMALADCGRAFASPPADPEWYLTRAQYQIRLGLTNECLRGLRDGFERTGSAVLEVEWIETLLDARHFDEALQQIEPNLRDSRWRSSWLLRRARARIGQGDSAAARTDLRAALEEINERLHPQHPDVTLLADRALGHALSGDPRAAKKDLARAKKLGAEPWLLRRAASHLSK